MSGEKKVAEMLLRDEVISLEEVEIVKYGLENLGSSLLGVAVTLIIGFCTDFLWGSFGLWILIFPLRKNAGGFHAQTKCGCLFFSSAMLFLSIICFAQTSWPMIGYILITLFFFMVIFLMAPVENGNKHLDKDEHRIYRKRTRLILLSESVLFLVAAAVGWKEVVVVITIDFLIVGVSLVAGKIKLRKHKQMNTM